MEKAETTINSSKSKQPPATWKGAAALKARLASKSRAPPLGDGVQLIMARLDEMQSRSDKLELQLADARASLAAAEARTAAAEARAAAAEEEVRWHRSMAHNPPPPASRHIAEAGALETTNKLDQDIRTMVSDSPATR